MITFDLRNIQKESSTQPKTIADVLQKIEKHNQGFYKIIDDKKTFTEIKNFAKKIHGKHKDIVVLGIGGSALGTICLQQSLKHLFENELKKNGKSSNWPKLHVLDNIDPSLITELEDIIDYKKTLFIVISKSGCTPETVAQYFYFRHATESHKLDSKKHFVFITDHKNGFLRKTADEEKIPSFAIPENVGGRFSVLTSVGLLPAALIGINIDKMLAGARVARDKFLSTNPKENLSFQLAEIQYALAKKGKTINVLIPYAQKLSRLADWYRQLLAESIGKKLNNKGKIVNVGITPINALGVTDQHSQLQLYNEGPNDKFFIFLEVEKLAPELAIPHSEKNAPKMSFNKLLKIELDATIASLTQNNRPNITIKIDEINAENLGALFMLFEGATAFLGEMFDINAFDQPGVELSKELTKKAIAKL